MWRYALHVRRDPVLTAAGNHGVLVDFEQIDAAHLHAAARRTLDLTHLESCIIGHSSLLLLFATRPPDAEVMWAVADAIANPIAIEPRHHLIEVSLDAPDAPDLGRLLEHLDATQEDFVAALAATHFHVRFLGFRAGFAYLDGAPRSWHLPRLAAPRTRVPAGSFGIAGSNAGFYPIESPGGWNLLGRSAAVFWDPWRNPPGLFAAGDEIRIRPVRRLDVAPAVPARVHAPRTRVVAEVMHPGQATVIVGGPRMARYASGMPCGGAFDDAALEAANRAVGNDPHATALEIAFVGPRLRMVGDGMLSWSGAPAELTVNGHRAAGPQQIHVNDGDVVAIGRVTDGVRGVLAFSGAIADPAAPFAVAPEQLNAGDTLHTGESGAHAPRFRQVERTGRLTIRVVAGPHRVSREMLQRIVRHPWVVTPVLNRVAVRVRSESTPPELPHDLASCGMQVGTVQWHPSGELVLMGPDHPITGGYLQPVTVIEEDHWKIAQLAPGEQVRFEVVG